MQINFSHQNFIIENRYLGSMVEQTRVVLRITLAEHFVSTLMGNIFFQHDVEKLEANI